MSKSIFISLFAVLHSDRYKKNLREIEIYKNFLETVALPWVAEDKKNLKDNTPKKIKKGYIALQKNMIIVYLDTQDMFREFKITREILKEYDNCKKYNAIGNLGKKLLNLLHNFQEKKI